MAHARPPRLTNLASSTLPSIGLAGKKSGRVSKAAKRATPTSEHIYTTHTWVENSNMQQMELPQEYDVVLLFHQDQSVRNV